MLSLASLLIEETKAAIYETALKVAENVGLAVSTWQPGDPTRSLYHLEAELLSKLEEVVVDFIKSGFLDYAEGEWLKILAEQVFNVIVPDATFATTSVVLTNTSSNTYAGIEPGDLTFKNATSGKTYRNTTGGDLLSGPGTTLTVTVVADEAGSESSAAAGEINEIVSGPLGVTCTNPTAAIGANEQDAATTRQQCRDKLGSFSPNGPRDAYRYVARNPKLTGTNSVTRVIDYPDSDTGDVLVYLASGSGGVSSADRALVEAAILKWATPLCITPTVASAVPVTIAITYELWVYRSVNKTAAEIKEEVEEALEAMFTLLPIGGDAITPGSGFLYHSKIESTIKGLYPEAFRCVVSTPAGDTSMAENAVPALGTVTATINLVVDK